MPRQQAVRTILSISASLAALLAGQQAMAQNTAEDAPAPEASTGQEIVVTGTLIRQTRISSPLASISADDITARGITNAAELVNTMPSNAGSEAGVDQLNQPLTAGTAQFNLRNLGLGSTLVLVNGRRQTLAAVASNDGSTFTDINSLVPLIALQRVEVVKDGAAATYGSDAVAGVVNFITRKVVDRPEISAKTNLMDGARQINVEGIIGAEVGRGNLVVAASYYSSTRLSSADRSFSTASTFGRPSWHSVSSFGQPGSYFVPSQNTYVPDPNCTNSAFPDSYMNSASDALCRFDFSGYYDLIPKEHRIQAFASYDGELGDNVKLNLEAAYAATRNQTSSSPSFPILSISPVVPASNPYNPFGEDVLFRGRLINGTYGPSIAHNDYDTFRLAGGLEGKLSKSWNWSLNATYSQQTALYNKPDTIKSRLINALNGLGGIDCNPSTGTPGVGACQYYNPFGTAYLDPAMANSASLINSLIGHSDLHGRSSLVTVDGLVSGDLFELGGETVQAALGAQYRRSTFRHDWGDLVNEGELITLGQAPDFSGSQQTASIFGEVKVPLERLAELTLSGRYEKYIDSFGKFTPKVALLVHPVDQLSLRASWGKAFRAPSVYQQVAVQASQPPVSYNGTFLYVNTLAYGDPDLKPEQSTNWNIGATFTPVRHVEFNIDYFRFKYTDLIVKENAQAIITQAVSDTNAGLSGTDAQSRLTFDTTGNLQQVRVNFINASSVLVKGLDVGARGWVDTSFGKLEARVDYTHISTYDMQTYAGGPVIHGAGSVNFNNIGRSMPKDRVEFGVNWTMGPHHLSLLGHYVSPYTNDRSGITETHIDSSNTYDIQYNLSLYKLVGTQETTLTLGVINVFDKNPPLAQLNLGFDPIVADPRGRVVTLGINQKF
ncbi:TonB-dependent receptor [Novosphingobium naphthalenivorans]|uniref:TonB-dependent receptor n=1 Tax=Novosphingobium naphthalenivorans TaxID=273168 RepID=UPI00082F46FC|nr:TonB-dependent receptor [Novosphingobium naphthalenivorans]